MKILKSLIFLLTSGIYSEIRSINSTTTILTPEKSMIIKQVKLKKIKIKSSEVNYFKPDLPEKYSNSDLLITLNIIDPPESKKYIDYILLANYGEAPHIEEDFDEIKVKSQFASTESKIKFFKKIIKGWYHRKNEASIFINKTNLLKTSPEYKDKDLHIAVYNTAALFKREFKKLNYTIKMDIENECRNGCGSLGFCSGKKCICQGSYRGRTCESCKKYLLIFFFQRYPSLWNSRGGNRVFSFASYLGFF